MRSAENRGTQRPGPSAANAMSTRESPRQTCLGAANAEVAAPSSVARGFVHVPTALSPALKDRALSDRVTIEALSCRLSDSWSHEALCLRRSRERLTQASVQDASLLRSPPLSVHEPVNGPVRTPCWIRCGHSVNCLRRDPTQLTARDQRTGIAKKPPFSSVSPCWRPDVAWPSSRLGKPD